MGNGVPGLFELRAARSGRAKAVKFPSPAIDDAEVDIGEADDPAVAVALGIASIKSSFALNQVKYSMALPL